MTDYTFYLTDYMGDSIPFEDFPRLIRQAWGVLSRYKRAYTVTSPEPVSEDFAACAIADTLYYFETAQTGQGGPVTSASIGSVSVNYAGSASVDLSPKAQEAELFRCACRYLDIYRGC